MYFEITVHSNICSAVYKVTVTPQSDENDLTDRKYSSFTIAAYEQCSYDRDQAVWLIGFECHGRAINFIEVDTIEEVFDYIQTLSNEGNPNSWAYIDRI